MVLRKPNHKSSHDFFWDAFDLKKYVFIDVRKQTRQKMEGFLKIIKKEILLKSLFFDSPFACVFKNYVFIKLREQNRQKREGFGACYV